MIGTNKLKMYTTGVPTLKKCLSLLCLFYLNGKVKAVVIIKFYTNGNFFFFSQVIKTLSNHSAVKAL